MPRRSLAQLPGPCKTGEASRLRFCSERILPQLPRSSFTSVCDSHANATRPISSPCPPAVDRSAGLAVLLCVKLSVLSSIGVELFAYSPTADFFSLLASNTKNFSVKTKASLSISRPPSQQGQHVSSPSAALRRFTGCPDLQVTTRIEAKCQAVQHWRWCCLVYHPARYRAQAPLHHQDHQARRTPQA